MKSEIIRVYKFYPQRWALEAIQRKRLKISPFRELNDPFEFLAANVKNKDIRVSFTAAIASLSKDHGLISFSESWENPVIWSHYADSHRGIALGFDIPKDQLEKIEYVSERIEITENNRFDKETISQIKRLKFDHWSYEKERRLIYKLPSTDPVTGLYFTGFDEILVLKEIVLGACYAPRGATQWTEELQMDGVEIVTSRLKFGQFQIGKQRNKNLWKTL